jgi:predicted porin
VAQDVSFAWHHLQIWAECYETRFQIPTVGNADTLAYYVEAKYKFTPNFSAALRWNQQLFNTVPDGMGGMPSWGSDIKRIDAAFTYRFSPHLQAKLQYSFIDQDDPVFTHQSLVAAQITLRF